MGHSSSIHLESWPEYDEKLIAEEKVGVAVQINGKTRAVIELGQEISEKEAINKALADEKVQQHIAGKEVNKIIYVPGKIVSILVVDK